MRLPCGCHPAPIRRNGPFPGRPSLFSLFALQGVGVIGIAQNLKSPIAQHSKPDQDKTGIDESEAVAVLLEKYEIVRDMFHGFDRASAPPPNGWR